MKVFLKIMSAALIFALAVCMLPSVNVKAESYFTGGYRDDIHSTMLVEFTFDEYYGEDDCDWVFNTATGYDQTDLGTKYDI